ncbi:MAG: Lrp/AsnC family transcriptional regulator [Roseivirga sp.]|nr:Lrp/AsnC family transcriptional regulator [Roseivirga sp.]
MLDQTDYKIIDLLQQDAKLTIKEIAGELGLTATPVHERIKKLERAGVIKKYAAIIDRERIGLNMLVFCSVSLKNHNSQYIEEFQRDIQQLTHVVDCYHVGGLFDYLLKVMATDMSDYQEFVSKKLAALENIGTVQSSFVMSEIKHSNSLPSKI